MGERTNADWLAALRGDQGRTEQEKAYTDLGRYLHVVLYNYLVNRRSNLQYLAQLDDHDLSDLASDFVQDTLMKFAQGDLLAKYRLTGQFTSWAAKVAVRETGQQLRRHQWTTTVRLEPATEEAEGEGGFPLPKLQDTIDLDPEQAVICSEVWNAIQQAFTDCLNPRQQQALAMPLQSATTPEIAEVLGTTANNVYILRSQARKILEDRMLAVGYTVAEILDVFRGEG